MLSETDPKLADMVRKQFPVWGAQQISVQHSTRLSPLLFIVASISPPKILLPVILFGFPLERLNKDVTSWRVADSVTKIITFFFSYFQPNQPNSIVCLKCFFVLLFCECYFCIEIIDCLLLKDLSFKNLCLEAFTQCNCTHNNWKCTFWYIWYQEPRTSTRMVSLMYTYIQCRKVLQHKFFISFTLWSHTGLW